MSLIVRDVLFQNKFALIIFSFAYTENNDFIDYQNYTLDLYTHVN